MKILIGFMMALILVAPNLQAQSTVGNGGDSFAYEFISTGRDTVQLLSWVDLSDLKEFNILAFGAAIERIRVGSKDHIILNGVEVGAANYPNEGIILVSQTFWPKYNPDQRIALVLHEYLGVMGINDTNYRISGVIYQRLQKAQTTPNGKPIPVTISEYVGGYVIDERVKNADQLAKQSYTNECLHWQSQAKATFGGSLGAINCGVPQNHAMRWDRGFISAGQFTFFTKLKPTMVRQVVYGDEFEKDKDIQSSLKAIASHQRACQQWLQDVKQTAGSHFVYASCGGAIPTAYVYKYVFHSNGLIILSPGADLRRFQIPRYHRTANPKLAAKKISF